MRRRSCPAGRWHSIGITTTSALGAAAISLIGAANVGGTLLAGLGWASGIPRNTCWPAIYTGRTIAAAAFILFPITPLSVIIFSVAMGSCGWRRCR